MEVKIKKKLNSAWGEMFLDVDFEIEQNSFVAVTGASGSGKTTLLRCLSGLGEPDSGYISFGGQVWFDSSRRKSLPTRKRECGFVFQDYALFPNMTLRENILYACGDKKRTDEFISMAELDGVSNMYPDRLSGGQKQRCALLRAVSRGPKLLLLDEPFSSLDGDTKKIFQSELMRWKSIFTFTVIMVSHDRAEVVRLAERVIHLKNGLVESDVSHKWGCPGMAAVIHAASRRVS